jgi:hypothetical protein
MLLINELIRCVLGGNDTTSLEYKTEKTGRKTGDQKYDKDKDIYLAAVYAVLYRAHHP